MRFVLIVIGSYVRGRGAGECWPSIRTLEGATRLSQRCIVDQIEGAIGARWLSRQIGQVADMKRRGAIYTLTLPTAEPYSAVNEAPTAERHSAVNAPRPLNVTRPTAERDSNQPLNVVPLEVNYEVEKRSTPVRARARANGFTLPDWIDSADWSAFEQHRKAKRAPMTTRAKELIVLKLEGFRRSGYSPQAVLNQSIERGWAGVFALKPEAIGAAGATARPWYASRSGIEAKGREFGLEIPASVADWQAFRRKVYEIAVVTDEMLRAAQVDFGTGA
jgi:hypothetical protein